jgi:glucose-6-phosphate isomerase
VDSLRQHKRTGHNGKPITDVVNIGIGGSDLGPRFVVSALQAAGPVRVHFVANIDPRELQDTLHALDPDTTLFITASKSFATLETRANTVAARSWLQAAGCSDLARHFIAVTANVAAAVEFGIAEDNIFPMWDWVGGRYSLWSAIGLPIAIATGWDSYQALLDGAREMDEHFRHAPLTSNMPALMALLECWYSDCWNAHSTLVLPYSHALRLFPAYLQQLSMESLGKSVMLDGNAVQRHSGMVIWGEPGTNSQHSFMQLLHQGTRFIPSTFIAVLPQPQDDDRSRHLFANCLSQSRTLMTGKGFDQVHAELVASGLSAQQADAMAPHRCHPGNRPSSTLVLPSLTARTIGALIALHEHKVFTQSVILSINAFDQWGVELGKRAASDIFAALDRADAAGFDDSTIQLIRLYRDYQ